MKKILFTLLLGMVVFGACSNDDPKEKRELELVHVYEHSYRYEDMEIFDGTNMTVSYGSKTDGKQFGGYGHNLGTWGYEITKELYELLQNTTVILYINNIKIETETDPVRKSWSCNFQNEERILFSAGGEERQVAQTEAEDFGKYYLFMQVDEFYKHDNWNNKDFINEFLKIEAGNRNVRLEYYK